MYRNNIQPSAPPLQPSAPPLPQNQSEVQNYIDQYIPRTDPYNAGPPRQEGSNCYSYSYSTLRINKNERKRK